MEYDYHNQQSSDVRHAVNAALEEQKKKSKKKKLIIFGVIAAIIIILIIALSSGGSESESSTDNPTNSVDASQEEKNENTVGDYECTVKSAKLCKDYAGKEAVLITYEFKNNGSEAISFDVALNDNVYQDGVELETAILDEDTDYFDVSIKPGVTKDVKKAYLLRDSSTQLEVEISEWISFNDDKIVTMVNITK